MSKKLSGKDALLAWAKRCTQGYAGVEVKNFHMSWKNGLAFCALLHYHDSTLLDYSSLSADNMQANLDLAFSTGERLGIPALIDSEDMLIVRKPEPLSIITYLSQCFHFWKTGNARQTGFGVANIRADDTAPSNRAPAALSRGPPATPSRPSNASPQCHSCSKPLSGATVQFDGMNFHKDCFSCTTCKKELRNQCLNVGNKPYCERCGRRAFVTSKAQDKSAPMASSQTMSEADMLRAERARREREMLERKKAKSKGSRVQALAAPAKQSLSRSSAPGAFQSRSFAKPQESTKKACASCRRDLVPAAKFCAGCGEPTQASPPPTPTSTATVKTPSMCPSCDRTLAAGARFCAGCGEPVRATVVASSSASPTAAQAVERLARVSPAATGAPSPAAQRAAKAKEARLRREREAKERADRLAAAKADREAKARAERETAAKEARERAEREAREQAEREAKLRAEREAAKRKAEEEEQARAERLAASRASQRQRAREATEARERAEREAREQAEREAKLRAEREAAKRKAEEEEQARAERLAASQREREREATEARERAEREAREQAVREAVLQAEREAAKAERLASKPPTIKEPSSPPLPSRNPPKPGIRQRSGSALPKLPSPPSRSSGKGTLPTSTPASTSSSVPEWQLKAAQIKSRLSTAAASSPASPSSQARPPPPVPRRLQSGERTASEPPRPSRAPPSVVAASTNDLKLKDEADEEDFHRGRPPTVATLDEFVWEDKEAVEGWLTKENPGGIFKIWKRRWFQVEGNHLCYYKGKPPGSPLLHKIPLVHTSSIDTAEHKRVNAFMLVTAERTYFLEAESRNKRSWWIARLKEHVEKSVHDAKRDDKTRVLWQSPIAKLGLQREGTLEYLTEKGRWKLCYLILKEGVLFRFKRKGASSSHKVPLYGAKLSEYQPEAHQCVAFQIKSRDGGSLVLRAHDEVTMQTWLGGVLRHRILIEQVVDSVEF